VIDWLAHLPSPWQWVVYALLGEGIAACWAFVILYSIKHAWWHNDFGRHLVALSSCLGLFLTYYGMLVFWPELPGKNVIRMVLFVALIVVINQRLWVFGRYEQARKREKKARAGEP
jgi:tetrahydromethanopterin S-methyltransferase subunit E